MGGIFPAAETLPFRPSTRSAVEVTHGDHPARCPPVVLTRVAKRVKGVEQLLGPCLRHQPFYFQIKLPTLPTWHKSAPRFLKSVGGRCGCTQR